MRIRRVKPHCAGGIFANGSQFAFLTGAPNFKISDFSILYQSHTRCIGPDPKIGVTVFKQINNPVAVQTGRVVFVENGEMISIKTHQAIERSNPKVAVLGLDHRDDFIAGKAFLAGPRIHNEGRIGSFNRACVRRKNESDYAKPQPCAR